MIAKIAVSAANFAIDKPYSYLIPEGMELRPGQRVQLPFGRGNTRCEGVVLAVEPGSGEKLKDKVDWMVESGIIYMGMPDMKYLTRLLLRMSMEMGGRFRISIQYDSFGPWEMVFAGARTSIRSFSLPIRPRRCDHFRLRIEGTGDARIYSITKTIEQGSDIS